MRIGIDAHTVGRRATGNETYVTNLVRALAAVDAGRNEYSLYVDGGAAARQLPVDGPRFTYHRLSPRAAPVRVALSLPLELARRPVDVLHVQYNLPPLMPGCARVVTVHDISFEHFPQCFTFRERWRNKVTVRASARRAHVVIAVSEYTKRDLVKTYGIDPDRIVVTPEAADPHFRPPEDPAGTDAVCESYGIRRPYFLYVGNIQPRKNLERLIQAYARLIAAGDVPHRLVIVGKQAWLYSRVLKEARRPALAGRVVLTGYVPQGHLAHLYAGADAFVFPSLFEGFGLPVLEAMACGTPVITSRTSSLPEVAGSAALYVNPYDIDGIAGALRLVASDARLQARLSTAGRRQAARFTWEETARRTLAAYEQALVAAQRDRGVAPVTRRGTATGARRY